MSRYRIIPEFCQPHFLTLTITRWLPVFTSEPYFRLIVDTLAHYRVNRGLLVHAYVTMPTHVHMIAATAKGSNLADIVRDFKRYTSKGITRWLEADRNDLFLWVFRKAAEEARKGSKYQVWQPGNHPETIESARFLRQKLDYLHDNPRRKGFVGNPEHWLYSSAGSYILGEPGVLEIDIIEVQ